MTPASSDLAALKANADDAARLIGEQRLRIKELEEALRPFAAIADRYSENSPDYNHVHSATGLTVGACRNARSALARQKPEPKETST